MSDTIRGLLLFLTLMVLPFWIIFPNMLMTVSEKWNLPTAGFPFPAMPVLF
jgi:hypothetical protein